MKQKTKEYWKWTPGRYSSGILYEIWICGTDGKWYNCAVCSKDNPNKPYIRPTWDNVDCLTYKPYSKQDREFLHQRYPTQAWKKMTKEEVFLLFL